MEFLIKFTEIMFSDFWHFIGYFLISLVKRNEKNNFYISEKNVNEKFIEELKKYGKKRATE